MIDELRRMAMFGSGVVELTKHRAEQMVKGLVKSGDISPGGAPALVQDLVERSRHARKELTRFVRDEIKNQIEGLGLAPAREVERLERRVVRLEDNLKKLRDRTPPSTGTAVGTEPATKPKSTAKKSSAERSTAKKGSTKKGAAKRTARTASASRQPAATPEAVTDAPAPRRPDATE